MCKIFSTFLYETYHTCLIAFQNEPLLRARFEKKKYIYNVNYTSGLQKMYIFQKRAIYLPFMDQDKVLNKQGTEDCQ